jgi:hypothetical protein
VTRRLLAAGVIGVPFAARRAQGARPAPAGLHADFTMKHMKDMKEAVGTPLHCSPQEHAAARGGCDRLLRPVEMRLAVRLRLSTGDFRHAIRSKLRFACGRNTYFHAST